MKSNFGDLGVSKSAILTVLAPLNLGFEIFLQFFKAEVCKNQNSECPRLTKLQFLKLLICQHWFHVKSECGGRKICKFPHCVNVFSHETHLFLVTWLKPQ